MKHYRRLDDGSLVEMTPEEVEAARRDQAWQAQRVDATEIVTGVDGQPHHVPPPRRERREAARRAGQMRRRRKPHSP